MNHIYILITVVYIFLPTKIFSQNILKYKIDSVNFNSNYNDFAAVFYEEDTLYFSDKYEQIAVRQFGGKRRTHFSDIYSLNSNNYKLNNLIKSINTRFNEGTISISSDGKTVFFTRNSYFNKIMRKQNDKGLNLQIFYIELLENGTWSKEKDLPFNSLDYSIGHPSISKDGTVLYFASDMPNGYGGTDIYKVEINNIIFKVQIESLNNLVELKAENFKFYSNISYNKDGNKYNYTIGASSDYAYIKKLRKRISEDYEDCFVVAFKNGKKINIESAIKSKKWRKPVNLGGDINSSANESFPFITSNNTLYFSSSDKKGFGGLDIYMSKKNNGEYKTKVNLGEPINSEYDDFSFVILDDKNITQTGFFASTRGNKKAQKSNIYSWESLYKQLNISGIVKTPDNNVARNIKLQITDADSNVTTLQTDINGKYSFLVKKRSLYNITIEDPQYFKYSADVSTVIKEVPETIKHEIQLETYPTLVVKPIDQNGNPIIQMRVIITDEKSYKKFSGITNNRGLSYEFFNEYNLGDEVKFDISLKKRGYLSKNIKFTSIIEHGGDIVVPVEYLVFVKNMADTINGRIYDNLTNTALSGEILLFDSISGNTIAKAFSNKRGEYKLIVPKKRGDFEEERLFTVIKIKGYEDNIIKFEAKSFENERPPYYNKDIRMKIKINEKQIIKFHNIYFDLGKSDLKQASLVVLDKLIEVMNNNEMTIELSAHTDSRSNKRVNKKLSLKRAINAQRYMEEKGIDKKRIIAKGYGERKLLNACKDGVYCSEEEHAINRRIEVKILSK